VENADLRIRIFLQVRQSTRHTVNLSQRFFSDELTIMFSGSCVGNANPGAISQTRVYGFDGFQTRVPWFDYVSPAGGQ